MSLFGHERPPPPGIYEYTQILTFHFTERESLSDDATTVGQVWAATLKTYLELEATGNVTWALVHEDPTKTKLFIDWRTAQGREVFEESEIASSLHEAWRPAISSPPSSMLYRFPHDENWRMVGLNSENGLVCVHFTIRFGESVPEERSMKDALSQLGRAVLKSPGGVAASGYTSGPEVDGNSYCLEFRYLGVKEMQDFLITDRAKKYLEVVRSMITSGGSIDIECMDTRMYRHGWQGSVEKTKPPVDPALARFFAKYARSSSVN